MTPAELRPFRRIWAIDFEFYQPDGFNPRVLCMSAKELRSGHYLDIGESQLCREICPFHPSQDLIIAYGARAEMTCFLALQWPLPVYILDLLVEFRLQTNEDRPIGRKLYQALEYFHLPVGDAREKEEMQKLAQRGGEYSAEEMAALQAYCRTDVDALGCLLPALMPRITYPNALVRGQFTRSVAQMETIGIPVDFELLSQLKNQWENIQTAMLERATATYGVFVAAKLNHARLAAYLKSHCPAWPLTASRKGYATDAVTRRDMVALYPFMATFDTAMTLRGTLKTLELPVGPDGRNRTPIWPFATKTARCAPSTTKYVFGLPAWLRSLVRPEEGRALAYLDYSQEEPAIAAVLSGDTGMREGYQIGGDLYLDFAKRVGAVPASATKQSHGKLRDTYKICLLASMYGQREYSLARSLETTPDFGRYYLQQLRQAYPRFQPWIHAQIDWAMLRGFMRSRLGWAIKVTRHTREGTLLNWPMQTTGSEILQRAINQLFAAGISVNASIHDAVLIEAADADIAGVVHEARTIMERASLDLLGSLTIRVEAQIIRYPERFIDKRGYPIWEQVYQPAGLSPEFLNEVNPDFIRDKVLVG